MKCKQSLITIFFLVFALNAEQVRGQEYHLYPIVRDTFNQFKDSLTLTGKIVACSGLHPQCGILCTSETFVFKLTEESPDYPHMNIYVAFTCFETIKKKELNKTLLIKVKKIATEDRSCFWQESKKNQFDSQKLPFYQLVAHSVKK